MISGEDLVGNLGAPLRSSLISRSRVATPSGPSPRRETRGAAADPLLGWDLDDMDNEEIEVVGVTSRRPMLASLVIDSDAVGGGNGKLSWRREFDGIGAEEEVGSLMERKGKNKARTPIRSAHSPRICGGLWTPLVRRPSKSALDEVDALLADAHGYDEGSNEVLFCVDDRL